MAQTESKNNLLIRDDQLMSASELIYKRQKRWISSPHSPIESEYVLMSTLDFDGQLSTNLTPDSLLLAGDVDPSSCTQVNSTNQVEDCALMCDEIRRALIKKRQRSVASDEDFGGVKLSNLFLKVPLFLQETDQFNTKWLNRVQHDALQFHVHISRLASLELSIQWLSSSSSSLPSSNLLDSKKPPSLIVGAECAKVECIDPYRGLVARNDQNYYYQLSDSDQLYDTSSTSHQAILYHALTGDQEELVPFHRPLLPPSNSGDDADDAKMEVDPAFSEQDNVTDRPDRSNEEEVGKSDGETKHGEIGQKPDTTGDPITNKQAVKSMPSINSDTHQSFETGSDSEQVAEEVNKRLPWLERDWHKRHPNTKLGGYLPHGIEANFGGMSSRRHRRDRAVRLGRRPLTLTQFHAWNFARSEGKELSAYRDHLKLFCDMMNLGLGSVDNSQTNNNNATVTNKSSKNRRVSASADFRQPSSSSVASIHNGDDGHYDILDHFFGPPREVKTRTLRVGDWVPLALIDLRPRFTVQWRDGEIERGVDQSRLVAYDEGEGDHQAVDEHDFYPGCLVSHIAAAKSPTTTSPVSEDSGVVAVHKEPTKVASTAADDQSVHDHGTIISVNTRDRMCVVQWFDRLTDSSSSRGWNLVPSGPPQESSLYELDFDEDNQLLTGDFMIVDTSTSAGNNSKVTKRIAGYIELAVPELDSFMLKWPDKSTSLVKRSDLVVKVYAIETPDSQQGEDLSDGLSDQDDDEYLSDDDSDYDLRSQASWETCSSSELTRQTSTEKQEEREERVREMSKAIQLVEAVCSLVSQHLLPTLPNFTSLHFTTSLDPSLASPFITPDSCRVLFGIVAANAKASEQDESSASFSSDDHFDPPYVMSMPCRRPLFPLLAPTSSADDDDSSRRGVGQVVGRRLSKVRNQIHEAYCQVSDERLTKMVKRYVRQERSIYATTLRDLTRIVSNLCPYLIKITPRRPPPPTGGEAKDCWTLTKIPVTRDLLEDPSLRVAIVGFDGSTSESPLNDLDPDWMTRVHYLTGSDINEPYNMLLVSEFILGSFTSVMTSRELALTRRLKALLDALNDSWLPEARQSILEDTDEGEDGDEVKKIGSEDNAGSTTTTRPSGDSQEEEEGKNESNVVPDTPISAIPVQERGQFIVEDEAPQGHHYYANKPKCAPSKEFHKIWRRDTSLLAKTAPKGIIVKAYSDRLDLFSIMIIGSADTPYEHGLFMFDLKLPADYPHSPPQAHYHSLAADRINPNLYVCGHICLSLLGTWGGSDTENWLPESSNLLQLVVSLKGLILNSEPYFNEAGYDAYRNNPDSHDVSRVYNESVVATLAQTMIRLGQSPCAAFKDEIKSHFRTRGEAYASLLTYWATLDAETYGTLQQQPSSTKQQDPQPSASSTGKFFAPPTKHRLPEFPLAPVSKGFQLSVKRPVSILRQFAASQKQQ